MAVTAGLAIEHYTGKVMIILYALAAWLAAAAALGLALGPLLRRRAADYPELADVRERLHDGVSDAELDELAQRWYEKALERP